MLPQLNSEFYFSQLFWLFICFCILVYAFKRYFIPRINNIITKRDSVSAKWEASINNLRAEIETLEMEIKNLKETEIKKSSEIIKQTIKKAESSRENQLKIIREENDALIKGTRERLNNEIKGVESTFKLQIDMTSQILFEKLFSQRI